MVGALFVNPQVIFPEPKICKCAGSCTRACVLSHYKALALFPEWALPEDERTRLRCIGTSDSSYLRAADPDHLACVSSRDAVDAVNAILRLRGPRWRGGVWSRSRLSRKDVEALKSLTTVCNLVPNPVDRSGVASYRRLSPDDAAAVLGHELDELGRSPTAWLRDLDCPPSGVSDVWATEMKLLGSSFSPLALLRAYPEIFVQSSPNALARGAPRPLWSFCCGTGAELPVLKRAGAPLCRISAVDCWTPALGTYSRRAARHYPEVPIELDGDLLAPATIESWTDAKVVERLERDGVPLIFCGWPCVGWVGCAASCGRDDFREISAGKTMKNPYRRAW